MFCILRRGGACLLRGDRKARAGREGAFRDHLIWYFLTLMAGLNHLGVKILVLRLPPDLLRQSISLAGV